MTLQSSILNHCILLALLTLPGHLDFVSGRIFPTQSSYESSAVSLLTKPDPKDAAATARWLVEMNSWGVLNTLSSHLKGAPFGNVVSYSDGLPKNGLGIPYFYLTALDPTARDAFNDPRASLTISELPIGTCRSIDPEDPTCSKINLNGKLVPVDGNSEEAEFAKTALFSKHPDMNDWPKNHNFMFFKLDIDDIFLMDWYGGPKPLTIEEYLDFKTSSSKSLSSI